MSLSRSITIYSLTPHQKREEKEVNALLNQLIFYMFKFLREHVWELHDCFICWIYSLVQILVRRLENVYCNIGTYQLLACYELQVIMFATNALSFGLLCSSRFLQAPECLHEGPGQWRFWNWNEFPNYSKRPTVRRQNQLVSTLGGST